MSALRALQHYPLWTIGLFSALLFFFNLDALTISIMEARNFLVAREMVTEGHWLLTTMNDLPRYEKPPLPAWITAPFIAAFGTETLWAYRLPTSLVSTAGVYALFFLVRRMGAGRNVALYAALVLATSFYYVVIRFEAPSDMYTHVCMLIAVYFWSGLDRARNVAAPLLLGAAAFGLSVLAKGPVSPYALFLPFVVAHAATHPNEYARRWKHFAAFFLLGVAIGASWYLYLRVADPAGILEVAEKETGNWTSYNVRPFYYYWSFFIQSGIWTVPAAVSLAYPYFRKRVKYPQAYKFSWLWTVAAVVFLSLIPEKKSRYLVPVLFPLAVNTAHVLHYLAGAVVLTRFDKIYTYLHGGVVLLICLSSVGVYFAIDREVPGFWVWFSLWVVAFFCIAAYIASSWYRRDLRFLLWSGVCMTAVLTTIGLSGTPFLMGNDDFRTLQNYPQEEKDLPAFAYSGLDPEIVWEWGETLPVIKAGDLGELSGRDEVLVLVAETVRGNFETALENSGWSTVERSTYDRNYFSAPGESGYKVRHAVHVYRLSWAGEGN